MPEDKIVKKTSADTLGITHGPTWAGIKANSTLKTIQFNVDGTVRTLLCDNGAGNYTFGSTAAGVATIGVVSATIDIAADSGCTGKGTGTITTTIQIPAGSLVLGVTARVTTILAGSDAIATWNLGYAGAPTAWGAALALAAGTTTSIANFTYTSPAHFTTATALTLTGTAGKIIDSGVVKLAIHYLSLTPAAA